MSQLHRIKDNLLKGEYIPICLGSNIEENFWNSKCIELKYIQLRNVLL